MLPLPAFAPALYLVFSSSPQNTCSWRKRTLRSVCVREWMGNQAQGAGTSAEKFRTDSHEEYEKKSKIPLVFDESWRIHHKKEMQDMLVE
ncbi:unnamed protein product [Sphenostylis stenocarpa]|uniref:Uncharacterized protein n=1 Tax=Sphenostylis stenocarpa TaxID=92480 RepID=A0AA86W6S2_9FABA|nr:unnamed protein product [Sphenostylis stenocarpa]